MNLQTVLALEAGLPDQPPPVRPSAAETRRCLEQQVWCCRGGGAA